MNDIYTTDLENSYLRQKTRLKTAEQYLLHEFKKLNSLESNLKLNLIKKINSEFSFDAGDLLRAFLFAKSSDQYINSLKLENKWRLFHIVSYGIYKKEL